MFKNNKRLFILLKEQKKSSDFSVKRNLVEELGNTFVNNLDFKNAKLIDVDMMEFKPGRHDVDKLFDDEGTEVPMTGKVYFFYVINELSKN